MLRSGFARLALFLAIAFASPLLVSPRAQAAIRDGGIDPANLGKGDWVYSMTDATNKLGGHVSSVTNETSLMLFYKSQGIRYFIVKAATNDRLFNGCYSSPQFTSALVGIAHANGVLIFGYNRSYGSNITAEIAISDYVFNQGADGFVWDAESEWESNQPWIGNNGPALAWQLCSSVRSNWPSKFLAHAPFPIINYHSSFPYEEFGYWCDAVMPQIYHSGWTALKGTASGGINWSDVNWAGWQRSLAGTSSVIDGNMIYWTNAIKPLVPVENVYGGGGSSPCEGTTGALNSKDVMEFIDYLAADPHCVTAGGYNGVNFWRADLHGAAQWANIKAGTSGSFAGVVNNLVMDDPSAATSGAWTAVRTFYNGNFYGNGSGTDTNSFGTNYLTRSQGTGSAYVQFTPKVVVPGDYNVYEWHPYRPDASASTPFIITYNGGSATVYANQQTNPGNWSLLGKFNFLAGTSGRVRITDATPELGSIAVADGLKLVFVPPTSPPAAPTGLSATAASQTQINLSWTDAATNETGFVVARSFVPGGPYADIGSVPGNTTAFSDTGLAPGTTGYYVVRATNFLGASAISAPASATTPGAPLPPSITSQPQSQASAAGQTVLFTVSATGAAPLQYQWWFAHSPIPGATTNPLTLTNVQPPNSGEYFVVVANAVSAQTSSPALLTVGYSLAANTSGAGTVSKAPDQALYQPNASVLLTASPAAGYAFIGWSGDASGTNNPLSLQLTTNTSVVATFVSTAMELVLDNPDPNVTFGGLWQIGTSAAGRYGVDYAFAVTAAGGLSNATYTPYIYTPGHYDVFVWYPQGGNRATNAPWSIVYRGGSVTVPVNEQINGGAWFRIGAGLPFDQGTGGYVRLSNDTGYSGAVVIADAARFLYTGPLTPPVVTNQPQSQAAVLGGTASFFVGAGSPLPLRYQWRRNSLMLAGQTRALLLLSNVQPGNLGTYSVQVSNDDGSLLSAAATLTQALQPALFSPAFDPPVFSLSFPTEPGPTYALEFKSRLEDAQWVTVTNIAGDGQPVRAFDLSATNPARFYRVHVQ